MDLEAVRGEEGLSTALLIANKGVLAPVCLLVCPQVSCRAVRPCATFEHALVALHLIDEEEGKISLKAKITPLKNQLKCLYPVFQEASKKVIC